MVNQMSETFWRKWDEWVPDGQSIDFSYPLAIVSPRENWGLVRAEITDENPDYPVKLFSPGSMVLGWRIRGYEWRHTPINRRYDNNIQEWENIYLKSRIAKVTL